MFKNIICLLFLTLITQSVTADIRFRVVGLFKDKALLDIDGKQRLLTLNKATPEGIILISANSNEAVLEVDGVRKTYHVESRISNNFIEPTGQRTVTLTPDEQGMYWVNGSINDFSTRFVIDTGATLVSLNKNEAKRLGLNYKKEGIKAASTTASGETVVYVVKLKKVMIGDIVLRNIDAAIHDDDFPPVILLGNSFLNRIDMKREGRLLQFNQK